MIIMWLSVISHIVSDNYLLLYNLTNPINISNTNSYKITFKSFTTSNNGSSFFSFARPSIQNTLEYNWLLGNITSNGYTNSLWDGDVSLVIYVFNLQSTVQYKVVIYMYYYILYKVVIYMDYYILYKVVIYMYYYILYKVVIYMDYYIYTGVFTDNDWSNRFDIFGVFLCHLSNVSRPLFPCINFISLL